MTTIEALKGCVKALNRMMIPVELDDIFIRLMAVRNTLNQEIENLSKKKEDKERADDPVQREETKPGNN